MDNLPQAASSAASTTTTASVTGRKAQVLYPYLGGVRPNELILTKGDDIIVLAQVWLPSGRALLDTRVRSSI